MVIYLIFGENEFEKRERLAQVMGGETYRSFDGEELTLPGLEDAVQGMSLFDDGEPIFIRNLSLNRDLWANLPDILADNEKTVILYELSPDKRTKTYKWLQKQAEVSEHHDISEYKQAELEAWVVARAKFHSFSLRKNQAEFIVNRLGFNQLMIDNFLSQLKLVDEVNDELLDELLPQNPRENVFMLFESVLKGDTQKIREIIDYLEQSSGSEGAYMTAGLITSQLVSLVGLVLADGDNSRVASDLKISPYALRKLSPFAQIVPLARVEQMIEILAKADLDMKTKNEAPWVIFEGALLKMSKLD